MWLRGGGEAGIYTISLESNSILKAFSTNVSFSWQLNDFFCGKKGEDKMLPGFMLALYYPKVSFECVNVLELFYY